MENDLNDKHGDCSSRLSRTSAILLRDYADSSSCLILGSDSHKPSANPDVLDIVITRDLHSPIDLTSCSALSSDHLPVLIDTRSRPSLHCPPDRPDVRRTD